MTMIRASEVLRAGTWQGEPDDTITLDEAGRHRRRLRMIADGGTEFLLDLSEAVLLRDGDGLRLDDGRLIVVQSAPESLYQVRPHDGSMVSLVMLAWHIGNRHLAADIRDDHIRIRRDHVIRTMLEGLGAEVSDIEAAFDPTGGAYEARTAAAGHGHHDHHHDGHTHDH
jgi:urease accessory protein